METLALLGPMLLSTVKDVLPVVFLLVFFQVAVLRQPFPGWRQAVFGMVLVVLGLALFLAGLERALFPLGRIMAKQLVDPARLGLASQRHWWDYTSVYLFGASLGFATAMAEPALIAVAHKAQQASRGAVGALGLRIAVSLGVALGIGLGCFRLVTGAPLAVYILCAYGVVLVQTLVAPKMIVPLAYDSGGVATSTVTVPLVAALGLGLASEIEGRDPLIDGFGLIAFACLFPLISVMGYAQLAQWRARRIARRNNARRNTEE